MKNRGLLAPTILAAGLVLAATIFGAFVYSTRAQQDTIKVVGSATAPFEADVAKWRITLSRRVPNGEQRAGYAALRADVERLAALLRQAGVPDTAIAIQPPNAQPVWGPQGMDGYNLQQPFYAISGDPSRLEALALDPSQFISTGNNLEMSQLEYFYSRIAELKHDLLARATADARARAQEIAGSSKGTVGRMTAARAGVFQITEPYSTEVSGFGVHNTATRRKEITVTVHADFRMD